MVLHLGLPSPTEHSDESKSQISVYSSTFRRIAQRISGKHGQGDAQHRPIRKIGMGLVSEAGQILCVVGARPNFMKIAPIMRAIAQPSSALSARLLHTGQHYDAAMKHAFFEQGVLMRGRIELYMHDSNSTWTFYIDRSRKELKGSADDAACDLTGRQAVPLTIMLSALDKVEDYWHNTEEFRARVMELEYIEIFIILTNF